MAHIPRTSALLLAASLLLPLLVVRHSQALAPVDPYADAVVLSGTDLITDAEQAVGAPDGDTAVFSATLGAGIELDMGAGEEGTSDLILHYANVLIGTATTRVSFLDDSKSPIAERTIELPPTGISIATVRVPYDEAPAPYRYVHIGSVLTSFGLDAVEAATHRPDSDDDGLPDQWELEHGLDPLDPTGDNGADGDPDSDGFTNNQEYAAGADPRQADTDGDGLPDGWELTHGLDPRDPTGPSGSGGDPDGDGLTNLEEYQLGRNPTADDNIEYFLPYVADDGN